MTRAKEELHLTHARLREFRGQTLYAIPSGFLSELPEEAVEHTDLSLSGGGTPRAIDAWRSGGDDAEQGWIDAGVMPNKRKESGSTGTATASGKEYVEGMLVNHDTYGQGRVTDVSGFGALRKVKVRFSSAGERTFLVEKAKLEIVRRG